MKELSQIKLIVSDFDGVMTDNRVWIDETGKETVCVSRADGWGIKMLRALGIDLVIMSTEMNGVVTKRAEKLNVQCIQGIADKSECLKQYCDDNNILLENVAYIGNDMNDYEAMKMAGVGIAPGDAYKAVKDIAHYVTQAEGGRGVIREVCRMIEEGMEDGKE